MKHHWHYLKYVLKHKWFVLLEGRKLGVPLWMLIIHDWDKFMPDEWPAYVNRFVRDENNPDVALVNQDYQMAWHLHQKRNKHHWHWWITPKDDGGIRVLPMKEVHALEMLADWHAMSRAFGTDVWAWYHQNKDKIILHDDTRTWVENMPRAS